MSTGVAEPHAESARRRVLVVDRIDPIPLVTLLRMYRCAAHGYAVPVTELFRVLEAVRRAPLARLDEDTVRHHAGGVVIPWPPGRGSSARPACVRRSPRELRHAPRLVSALRDAIEYEIGRPLRYHVYGGFARACVTGELFADVDVAAAASTDLRLLRALRDRPIRTLDAAGQPVTVRVDVRRRVVSTPAALVAEIELVMLRIAFSTTDGCFHMDPDCLASIASGVMSLRPVDSRIATPARTIGRTLKYAARGARLPFPTLLALLEDYRRTPAVVRWGERRLRSVLRPGDLVTGGRA